MPRLQYGALPRRVHQWGRSSHDHPRDSPDDTLPQRPRGRRSHRADQRAAPRGEHGSLRPNAGGSGVEADRCPRLRQAPQGPQAHRPGGVQRRSRTVAHARDGGRWEAAVSMSTRTKRKPINSPPHMVALHEAAHAVMALVVGGTVKEVSLAANPERGWAAYTDVKWNGQTEWPEVFMQYLAGYAAEITLCRLSRWQRHNYK